MCSGVVLQALILAIHQSYLTVLNMMRVQMAKHTKPWLDIYLILLNLVSQLQITSKEATGSTLDYVRAICTDGVHTLKWYQFKLREFH